MYHTEKLETDTNRNEKSAKYTPRGAAIQTAYHHPKTRKSPEFQGIPGQVCGRGRRARTLGTRFWRATVQILDSFRYLYLVPRYTGKRLKV
ncbi:hypothetical protein, partial [Neglectibacter sp. 59]|uniref:hypothetical protein n=1 Tax=Neglectibacter sp. 59 TaxID=2304573 RepID=UPI0013BC9462